MSDDEKTVDFSNMVTLGAFAKIIGVKGELVYRAARRGQLTVTIYAGRRWVDPETAKIEWEQNRSPSAVKKGLSPKSRKPGPRTTGAEVIAGQSDLKTEIQKVKTLIKGMPPDNKYMGLTTADAERQEKVWRAKLAELKYLEQAGNLVSVDKIKNEAFELGRKTRDAVLSIPPRLCHELAAETDPHKVEVMLMREINDALEKVTTKPREVKDEQIEKDSVGS